MCVSSRTLFNKEMEKVDVLIIGAGCAGLSAAARFCELQVTNFHILEARDRVGGRVDTINFHDVEVSTGPFYLHGLFQNPIYSLVNKLNIPVYPSCLSKSYGEDSCAVRKTSDGKDVSTEFAVTVNKHKQILKRLFKHPVDVKDVLLPALVKEIGWIADSAIGRTCESLYYEFFNGVTGENLSGYSESMYFQDDDDLEVVVPQGDGFKKVIHYLADKAGHEKIHLSTMVVSINWGPDSSDEYVEVQTNSEGKIVCWKAKYVLITIPPQLLFLPKAQSDILDAHIHFNPQLPAQKQAALRLIQQSNYTRILVAYKDDFTEPTDALIRVIDSDKLSEDNNKYFGPKFIFWEHLSNFIPGFDCGAVWNTVVVGYWADRCMKMSNAELTAEVGEALAAVYPEKREQAMSPLEVRCISLKEDPFALGSYPYCKPGANAEMENALMANCGRLYFAGDGYRLALLGSMQAAYLSGSEAADDISDNLSKSLFSSS